MAGTLGAHYVLPRSLEEPKAHGRKPNGSGPFYVTHSTSLFKWQWPPPTSGQSFIVGQLATAGQASQAGQATQASQAGQTSQASEDSQPTSQASQASRASQASQVSLDSQKG